MLIYKGGRIFSRWQNFLPSLAVLSLKESAMQQLTHIESAGNECYLFKTPGTVYVLPGRIYCMYVIYP
jgi:hypothetical protein